VKTKVSPAAVGVFVLGALALGMIALLSFGGLSLFSRPQRFMVYFDESIHGLDLGSPVKLRGVRVGRVVDLAIHYDDTDSTNRSVVAVTCELNRNVITDAKGAQLRVTGPGDIQMMVDNGLRAQLGVLGLATGLLFVELNFSDPQLHPPTALANVPKYVVIPAMPSAISEYQASLSEILSDLRKVDFTGISKEIKTLLASTNRKVNELDLKTLGDKLGRAADSVTTFVDSPETKLAMANLNATLVAARSAMERLDGQVGPLSDELKQTLAAAQTALKALDATAVTTRRFVQQQNQLGDDFTATLRQVAEAATALDNLAAAIERNPSSLLVGKKKAPQ
jgi:paraquat-inducible protein B